MPELPEVETVARQLGHLLSGRSVRTLEILDPLLGPPGVASLAGRTVGGVRRLGKQVLLELDRAGAPLWLAFHLRMTGRLIWREGGGRVSPRHLRARLRLEGGWLLFYDPRRFGTLHLCNSLAELEPAGLDPLSGELTDAALAGLLAGSPQAIKPWLLRQDRLVGLGNIYASEILFAAGIDPRRPARSLGAAEIRELRRGTRAVLERAIERCGTTFSDFQDARGLAGSFQDCLGVYGREGEPCPRCGTPVERLTQQQRSTFWCARCQR